MTLRRKSSVYYSLLAHVNVEPDIQHKRLGTVTRQQHRHKIMQQQPSCR